MHPEGVSINESSLYMFNRSQGNEKMLKYNSIFLNFFIKSRKEFNN
jgi:hypothetical protein